MGGAIATKTACEVFKNRDEYSEIYDKFVGLFIIDVVEGTAMDALPFMESIVKSKPKSFTSVEEAIAYMVSSKTISNRASARVSVPTLLKKDKETGEIVWITDLMTTRPYWKEWFTGLTANFLSVKIPKVLLLAGSERMDTELTFAQMQGKFKLDLVRNVGHVVHEDNAKETAAKLKNYIETFKIKEFVKDNQQIKPAWGANEIKVEKYAEYKKQVSQI